MKAIRFSFVLLLLALAIGFSPASVPSSSALEAAPKCECFFPNSGAAGVKDEKEGCKVVECWVDIT